MFPVDSITWEVISFHSDDNYFGNFIYRGDTVIINDFKYHKIYGGQNGLLVREDTVNGKTWYRSDTTDLLIMDLELKLNEEIINNYGCCYNTSELMAVRKIDTMNNRKIIEFNYGDNFREHAVSLKFIEGIGCNFGFPNSNIAVVCNIYYNEDIVYALDTVGLSCPIMYNVSNFKIKECINLFPNPVSSIVQIQLENPSLLNSQINFFNINGKLLQSKELTNLLTKIDVSTFKNQMLFFKVKNNHHLFTGKILKQ